MRFTLLLGFMPLALAATPAAAQIYTAGEATPADPNTHDQVIVQPRDDSPSPNDSRDTTSDNNVWTNPARKFDWNRPEPGKGGYFADDYHRIWAAWDGKRLSRGDRVYRGRDLRYYCRRWDGATNLVDARGNALLGDALRAGGTAKLRDIAGEALAQAIARREIRCGGETPGLTEVDAQRGRDPRTEAERVRNLSE